jgi:hypothetical protein
MTARGVHQRCPQCGRLLVPVPGGELPPHRIPPPKLYGAKSPPLTGADRPWCAGGGRR